jgi:hypothetical protein
MDDAKKIALPTAFHGRRDGGIELCLIITQKRVTQRNQNRSADYHAFARLLDGRGLSPQSVTKRIAPALVVHWAGMKKWRVGAMVGGDLLLHFERFYYNRMFAGKLCRILAICQHFFIQWYHFIRIRVILGYRKWLRRLSLKAA